MFVKPVSNLQIPLSAISVKKIARAKKRVVSGIMFAAAAACTWCAVGWFAAAPSSSKAPVIFTCFGILQSVFLALQNILFRKDVKDATRLFFKPAL